MSEFVNYDWIKLPFILILLFMIILFYFNLKAAISTFIEILVVILVYVNLMVALDASNASILRVDILFMWIAYKAFKV